MVGRLEPLGGGSSLSSRPLVRTVERGVAVAGRT
jgi:hypothetical protein